jgi:hypothetical protein
VRVILALAAIKKWPLFQLDVKNAFLHGDPQESVSIQPPPTPGFSSPRNPNLVCKLKKALYGLKQAPRAWFERCSRAVEGLVPRYVESLDYTTSEES